VIAGNVGFGRTDHRIDSAGSAAHRLRKFYGRFKTGSCDSITTAFCVKHECLPDNPFYTSVND